MSRIYILIFLLFSSHFIKAQTAELELVMSFDGIDDGVITGQRREFELTVTNHGPEEANPTGNDFFFVSSDAISSNDQWVPDVVFELDVLNSPTECFLRTAFADPLPGQNPNYAFSFIFLQLEAG